MARSLQPSEDIKKNLRTLVIHRFAVLEPKAGKTRQEAGGRRQKAEQRQETKGRTETRDKRQKAEQRQETRDKRQKAEGRRQKAEGRRQKARNKDIPKPTTQESTIKA
ncbi:hypothetical protein HYPBUDRAFT_225666 [Hyphopichia burtonii NRRL Y-1933]|uniref:Uncharacterized protein n=1 Tax=Hyphopichia burtonii NRRL Y-1933 TaxID=984485 RepID=A0A1E4RED3_9ASCO|nr:hypothetical protein HYPBUDRAFT_225666 [Hyphopichia burtonii NRRL Y-1933]ODV65475.1 hypothetical protein HYPBUDRAFT_225666 [Hyphopichia burtonii NRRL Y-1933]